MPGLPLYTACRLMGVSGRSHFASLRLDHQEVDQPPHLLLDGIQADQLVEVAEDLDRRLTSRVRLETVGLGLADRRPRRDLDFLVALCLHGAGGSWNGRRREHPGQRHAIEKSPDPAAYPLGNCCTTRGSRRSPASATRQASCKISVCSSPACGRKEDSRSKGRSKLSQAQMGVFGVVEEGFLELLVIEAASPVVLEQLAGQLHFAGADVPVRLRHLHKNLEHQAAMQLDHPAHEILFRIVDQLRMLLGVLVRAAAVKVAAVVQRVGETGGFLHPSPCRPVSTSGVTSHGACRMLALD